MPPSEGQAAPVLAFPRPFLKITSGETEALSGNDRAELPDRMAQQRSDPGWSSADHQGWWQTRRAHFDIYISQFVLDEAGAGDTEAARERMAALHDLPVLDITDEAGELAAALVASLALPAKAATDAAHIALAAVHGMHFLLTWNCTHIANAEMAVAIDGVCRERGFSCPVICTPEELMGV